MTNIFLAPGPAAHKTSTELNEALYLSYLELFLRSKSYSVDCIRKKIRITSKNIFTDAGKLLKLKPAPCPMFRILIAAVRNHIRGFHQQTSSTV